MILLILFVVIFRTESIPIRLINNGSLIPFNQINATTMFNITCQQCLCANQNINAAAINCFESNYSCQFFYSLPLTYRIRPTPRSRLYFPQQINSNSTRCCASNWTDLLGKLANATVISINISSPRFLVIDNHNYLVTVSNGANTIKRYYTENLTVVDLTSFSGAGFMSISYFGEAYYMGRYDQSILVVNSNSLTVMNVITSASISGTRDIIFPRNGHLMVLTSTDNNMLLFFNRSTNTSTDYQYAYNCSTTYGTPHGLSYVNDSFFYVTSWYADIISSYTLNSNLTCTETVYINATSMTSYNVGGSSHSTIDECGRIWLSNFNFGLFIYDQRGFYLGNFSKVNYGLFDTLLTDNYVMYLSDNVGGRILRLDPHLTC